MNKQKVTIRRTKESDLFESLKLIARTMNHLLKKSGLKPFKFTAASADQTMVHFLKADPEASYVALDGKGTIVGFTQALIRGNEWYLAYLFVDPRFQSTGVGKRLLKLAMDYGRKNGGITRWALATFAYNPQALAIYSKQGMTPQTALLVFTRDWKPGKKPAVIKPKMKLAMEIVTSHRLINRLTKLDVKVRGTARPEEHFFWTGNESHKMLAFYDDKKLIGYSVVTTTARIGPLAATKAEYLSTMLAMSVNYGIEVGQNRQIIFANGENVEVVQLLLNAGFHIAEATVVMASERFSDSSRYIPGHLAHY
jgi:GNAT superfamily N-acetyltransferase